MSTVARGEVWSACTGAVRKRSATGTRPVIVVSADVFNQQPFDVVFVVPCTTHDWQNPLHVRIDPPEGGVRENTFAMCDALMPVRREMLIKPWDLVDTKTIDEIDERIRDILGLL